MLVNKIVLLIIKAYLKLSYICYFLYQIQHNFMIPFLMNGVVCYSDN